MMKNMETTAIYVISYFVLSKAIPITIWQLWH